MDEATGIDVYGHNGIAVGDYNGDGLEDLYVCQPSGLPNRLYRNNGNGTFDDVSAAAGVDVLDGSTMALFGDLDNDGDQDLVVVAGSRVLLFVNDGKGRFAAHTKPGFAVSGSTLTSAALADFDRDGDLDLYVCAYDFWTPGAAYDAPTPYYDATNGPPNFLYRNRGDGSFEDVTDASGMGQNNNRFSFAASWADYDKDGWPDLYVANDFGRNNLYRNNGNGTFTDVAARAGVEDLAAGMSASWGDYDGDGWLDLYVSNMWSSAGQRLTFNPAFAEVASDQQVRAAFQRQARGNSLFRNNGDGTFRDVTHRCGRRVRSMGVVERVLRLRQRRETGCVRDQWVCNRSGHARFVKFLLAAGRVANTPEAERLARLQGGMARSESADPLRRIVERPRAGCLLSQSGQWPV